jgi:ABC-type oligopeptide transport system substrate-binding subunit
LNLENPKFADVDFREAILRALDSASLVRKTFGPTVGVANGVLPETVAGHGEDPCKNVCDFNLTAAKAALARAFPAGGVPTFSIDYDDTPAQANLALAAQEQLRAAGIETTPRPHPISDYDDFLANGEPDLFRLGWVALDPSAEAFLFPVFASDAPENVAHIKSLASDLLVISASTTGSPKKRAGLYAKAERAILQQVAVKPVVQYRSRFIARSTVKALSVDALGGIFSGYAGLENR